MSRSGVPRAPMSAAVLAVVLVLAGCSDESPEGDSTEPTEPSDDTPASVTIAMSGDVLLHNTVWASAQDDAAEEGKVGYDFAPMFASMKPVIGGADLAICHMETPLGPREGPFQNYPLFSVPPQVLPALEKTGYDICTTASNHSADMGFDGIARTIDAFRRNDLPFSGTAATRRQARRTPMVEARGVRIAVLSYTFGTNGMPVEKPWSVNLIDPDEIKHDAAKAKDDGADLVLVALHDGTEYVSEPTEHQREVVDEITESDDIDLVYGHHAHTSQPFDVVNGTWVAYGLGNFIAQQSTSLAETYRGTTASFTFTDGDEGWDVSKARFVPTQITMPGEYADSMRVLDAQAALADPDTPESLKQTLRETISTVSQVSFDLGARRDGLRMLR
ncbi:MAG: CapA family protein, partial [Actinomycetia bacterium]|nr:CapA family protein [Actinomycetes bacterium]